MGFSFIGLAILLLAVMQALLLTWNLLARVRRERTLAAQQKEMWSYRVATAKVQLLQMEQRTQNAWNGFRKFEVKRKEYENESKSICSFYLWPHDDKPLPPFQPGQFLTFSVKPPSAKAPILRCYSLSERPLTDYYRVTIRKLSDGLSSCYFHNTVQEGDYLNVRPPSGVFHIEPKGSTPLVMIAGGVGVTPFLSMFRSIATQAPGREAWLFYSSQSISDLVNPAELERVATQGRNLHLHFCITGEKQATEPLTLRNVHHERITTDLLDRLLPSLNYHFYLCGPEPMMLGMEKALKQWGVKSDRIHYENFEPPKPPTKATRDLEVTFKQSDKSLAWDSALGSLQQFAQAHDIPIPMSCGAGNCGTCKTAIREGEVEYFSKPGLADLDDGECLTCVCIPKTNLVLDA